MNYSHYQKVRSLIIAVHGGQHLRERRQMCYKTRQCTVRRISDGDHSEMFMLMAFEESQNSTLLLSDIEAHAMRSTEWKKLTIVHLREIGMPQSGTPDSVTVGVADRRS